MAQARLTVVIPAYNEAERIGRTLDDYLAAFDASTTFLVVPNACTDGTVALVASFERRFPGRISQLVISESLGKGGAVHAGLRQARTALVGYLDADGATPPAEFQKLVAALDEVDVAVASRWTRGSRADRKLIRSLASLAFILARQAIVPLPIWDTQCGAKVMRRSVLTPILPLLKVRTMAFDVELLAFLHARGARMREVPTTWFERGGSAKLSSTGRLVATGLGMLRTLLAIRRRRHLAQHTL